VADGNAVDMGNIHTQGKPFFELDEYVWGYALQQLWRQP
jgi:hypothetical protein